MKYIRKLIERLYFKQPTNLAMYDQLTKCHNYNWLQVVANKKYLDKELWITVIDLNGFKKINDTKGHIYGNSILQNVAEQLNRVKELDEHAHVVRFGGDEFMVMSKVNIEPMILRDATNLISFGTAFKKSNMTIIEAMNEADKKMYEYKKSLYDNGIIGDRRVI